MESVPPPVAGGFVALMLNHPQFPPDPPANPRGGTDSMGTLLRIKGKGLDPLLTAGVVEFGADASSVVMPAFPVNTSSQSSETGGRLRVNSHKKAPAALAISGRLAAV